jgi:hypothetical protein
MSQQTFSPRPLKVERHRRGGHGRRALLTGIVFALIVAGLGTASTFSAFSGATSNTSNSWAAGTVVVGDNDSGSAMLTMTGMKPGDTDTSCITVTSTGTLSSALRMYGTTGGTGLAPYLSLVVTRGTGGSFDNCTGFAADAGNYIGQGAGVLYNGLLSAYPTSFATSIPDLAAVSTSEVWTTGETHSYRFALTVADNNAAQGLNYSQTFTWDARSTASYGQVIMADGPLTYWRLDETSGTTAADSTGRAPGTYTNSPTLGVTSGVTGGNKSVTFTDLSSDMIVVGDVDDFAGTSPFTVELWMAPTPVNGYWRRVMAKEGAGGWEMLLGAQGTGQDNYVIFSRDDTYTPDNIDSGFSLTANTWYHVAVTYDGTNMRMYVNGVLRNTLASSVQVPDHPFPLTLGDNGPAGTDGLGGGMDEVAMYNYPLSAAQIAEHYVAGK